MIGCLNIIGAALLSLQVVAKHAPNAVATPQLAIEDRGVEHVHNLTWSVSEDGSLDLQMTWDDGEEVDLVIPAVSEKSERIFKFFNDTTKNFAVLSIGQDGHLSGIFRRDDKRIVSLTHIETLRRTLMDESLLVDGEYFATESTIQPRKSSERALATSGINSFDEPRELKITMVGDHQFKKIQGGVNEAEHIMDTVVEMASAVLYTDFNIKLVIHEKKIVNLGNCPVKPEERLLDVVQYSKKLDPKNKGALVHLLTGCRSTTFAGFAYIGQGCTTNGFDSGYTSVSALHLWETFLHEIGHGLGGVHPVHLRKTGGVMDYPAFGNRGRLYLLGTKTIGFTEANKQRMFSSMQLLSKRCPEKFTVSPSFAKFGETPKKTCGDDRCCKNGSFLTKFKSCGIDGACSNGECVDPCKSYGMQSCGKPKNGGCLLSCKSNNNVCTNRIIRSGLLIGAMPEGTACMHKGKAGTCNSSALCVV